MEPLTGATTFCSLQPATPEQWLAIKPIFLKLYLDDNKTLNVVRRELEEKHNFRATPKAFKRRIEAWEAFKNYKGTEKEELVKQKTLASSSGTEIAEHRIRGKPVKWHRIRRYERTQARKSAQRIEAVSVNPVHSTDWSNGQSITVCPRKLSDSNNTALLALKNFYDWTASTTYPDLQDLRPDLTQFADLFTAVSVISQGSSTFASSSAWRTLHNSCRDMPALVASGYEQDIWCWIVGLTTGFTNKTQGSLSQRIAKYICSLCFRQLDAANPLNQLLKVLRKLESVILVQQQTTKVYYNTIAKHMLSQTPSNCLRLLGNHVLLGVDGGNLDSTRNIIDEVLNLPDLPTDIRCHFTTCQTEVLYRNEDFELCILRTTESIAYLLQTEQFDHVSESYITIAHCHQRLNNKTECIKHARLAFQTCCDAYGCSDVDTVNYFNQLLYFLRYYEEFDEAERLEKEYSAMLEDDASSVITDEERLEEIEVDEDFIKELEADNPFRDDGPLCGGVKGLRVTDPYPQVMEID